MRNALKTPKASALPGGRLAAPGTCPPGDGRLLAGKARLGNCMLKSQDVYSDTQLRLAAHLYYADMMDQTSLAEFLNVSQAKVSRLLATARERGYVRFLVEPYEPRDCDLEERLQKKFCLSSVAVIRAPDGATAEDQRRFVAHFGSPVVTSLIQPHTHVVVAGGRTISELIRCVPEDTQRHVTILQALGIVDSQIEHVDAHDLGRSLARRWGGCFMTINTPAVADLRRRDSFLPSGQIRLIRQRLGQADAAIVAVGTLTNSVFANRYIASREDISALQKCGAIGEMCGRFFDREGRECNSPWRHQVVSVELEHLRKFPQVIAVSSGRDRSAAVAAAIRGRLLKSLVIDADGAKGLLEM